MEKKNIIQEKSYLFALKIIKLYKSMASKNEYVISKQILRCGTSIGANVEEALGAHSRADFHAKMIIAFKEARETNYWLRLLKDSQMIDIDYLPYIKDSEEVIRILNAITRKTRFPKQDAA